MRYLVYFMSLAILLQVGSAWARPHGGGGGAHGMNVGREHLDERNRFDRLNDEGGGFVDGEGIMPYEDPQMYELDRYQEQQPTFYQNQLNKATEGEEAREKSEGIPDTFKTEWP